ncbi:hypothetical protein [Paraburkholderia azotifigens]|uniref:Uncharacterized protein n=1 Tax=Paraburkholderia azotifigens TaxID=2057004 RepID=A0A5C6VR01_9BURK|nr:hypothetical protein [Paraburkholderia azotifigens]TXC87006.1 hypothetical protein FRZ40_05115 [Paraburkholderia azotifigens]
MNRSKPLHRRNRQSAALAVIQKAPRHSCRAGRVAPITRRTRQAANLTSVRTRKLRAFETGQIRDNFRQTQPCNGRMALPARQVDRSIPRLTVNKI